MLTWWRESRPNSLVFLLKRTLIPLDQNPTLFTSFNLNHSLTLNINTLAVRASAYELCRDISFQCIEVIKSSTLFMPSLPHRQGTNCSLALPMPTLSHGSRFCHLSAELLGSLPPSPPFIQSSHVLVFSSHYQASQNANLMLLCYHFNPQRHLIPLGIKTKILEVTQKTLHSLMPVCSSRLVLYHSHPHWLHYQPQ